jgi:hypothetical protein
LRLVPAKPGESPFGDFHQAVDVTVKVERFALRRRPMHDTVTAQIDAMAAFAKERGRGEVDPRELAYVPQRHPESDAEPADPIRFEATRLGVAAFALFPLLRLDRGPADLGEVALKVLEQGLGRDAVVQPIPDDAYIAKGDFTPSLHNDVAYLWIRSLDEKIDDRVLAVLEQWAAGDRPPRAVVLDLGECQEAVPSVAARVFDEFSPGEPALGLIFRNENAVGVESRMFRNKSPHGSAYAHTPVFVVTSPDTNSVAEALAFALRLRRHATLIGGMTAGTGRLLGWIRLPRPEVLGVTVADVIGADGEPLAGRALVPDVCAGPDGLHPLKLRTPDGFRAECTDAEGGADENAVTDYVRSALDAEGAANAEPRR